MRKPWSWPIRASLWAALVLAANTSLPAPAKALQLPPEVLEINRLIQEAAAVVAQDPAAAEARYRRAIEIGANLTGRFRLFVDIAENGLAGLYLSQRRYAEAAPLHLRLIEGWETSQAPTETLVASINATASQYREAGLYDVAGQMMQRALALSERNWAPDDARILPTLLGLAALRQAQGRYAEVEALLRRALQIAERRPGEIVALTVAAALGDALLLQGQLTEAESLLRRYLAIGDRTVGSAVVETLALRTRLGELYTAQGRYPEADRELRAAVAGFQAPGVHSAGLAAATTLIDIRSQTADPFGGQIRATTSLAKLYRLQGWGAEAEILLAGFAQSTAMARGTANPAALAAYLDLADLYRDDGRHGDADPIYRRVLQDAQGSLGRNNPLALRAADSLASSLLAQRRYREAEPLFRQALQGREQQFGRDNPATLAAARGLGELFLAQNRGREAEPLLSRAFAGNRQALGNSHPDTIEAAALLLRALLTLRPRTPDALAPARTLVEGARVRRRMLESRRQDDQATQTSAGHFALFSDAAWTAAQVRQADRPVLQAQAFVSLQESMAGAASRSIAEQAARRFANSRGSSVAALVRERDVLERQRALLDQEAAQNIYSGLLASIRTRAEGVQRRLAEIDDQLRSSAPDYFALTQPTPLDGVAAQRLLAPDEAILMVVPSAFGTHVVAVTRDAIEWRRSDWNAGRVRAAVQSLRRDMEGRPRVGPGGARAFDRTTAHQLYRELVGPVAGLLQGRRQVYVAAGGSLAALPFSVLVTAPPAGADDDPGALRATRWFGDEAALVHIPSIQALALLRQAPRSSGEPGSFFGVGNPLLRVDASTNPIDITVPRGADLFLRPGRTRDGGVMANIAGLNQLSPLPGTADELEAVRATLGAPASSLLMAERATEPNVRNANLSRTRILLFSTHGLTVAEGAYLGIGESGLVLTPPRQARDGDDGFLAASEVTTLRLDADWVILSACNTATGDGVNSAGLGALARAFFYAGARNLLASHWVVNDGVAPIMINRTLALERAGTPRAEAFRQAMREIRMDASADTPAVSLAHPYYWAPFVLIGDGGR